MKTYLECYPCFLRQALDKVFFLLQVKCPVIGGDVGAAVGGIVLKQGR